MIKILLVSINDIQILCTKFEAKIPEKKQVYPKAIEAWVQTAEISSKRKAKCHSNLLMYVLSDLL